MTPARDGAAAPLKNSLGSYEVRGTEARASRRGRGTRSPSSSSRHQRDERPGRAQSWGGYFPSSPCSSREGRRVSGPGRGSHISITAHPCPNRSGYGVLANKLASKLSGKETRQKTNPQSWKLACLQRYPLAGKQVCLLIEEARNHAASEASGSIKEEGRIMIIALTNSKGGVGKSTLAVHLTAWLMDQGQAVRCTASVDLPTPPLEFVSAMILVLPSSLIEPLASAAA